MSAFAFKIRSITKSQNARDLERFEPHQPGRVFDLSLTGRATYSARWTTDGMFIWLDHTAASLHEASRRQRFQMNADHTCVHR